MAQLYYSPVTVNTGQVPSTQTDFPVLVSYTDARFKDVAHSGHVNSSSGFDIRPYSDSGLTTALTYELERYNAATGEVVMWVKRSSLADGNVTYLGYGDTTLTTDGSSTATWSNGFTDVMHLRAASPISYADSSGNFTPGQGPNAPTSTSGKIGDGASFLATGTQSVNCTQSTNGTNYTALTYSCWVNPVTLPAAYNAVIFKNPNNTTYNGLLVKSNGKLFAATKATTQLTYDGTGSHTLSTGTTWYYLTLTYNSTAGLIAYVNGASDNTVAANGNGGSITADVYAGLDQQNGRYWNGKMDEIRLANVARSADWITTEYNNQSAPGTFATLGTEASLAVTRSGWFVFF